MSIAAVREYFDQFGMADKVLEFTVSSATVDLAAQAVGVIPARIAKSLSFKVDDKAILIIAAGDAKVDNSKFKQFFHTKAKMLTAEEVEKWRLRQLHWFEKDWSHLKPAEYITRAEIDPYIEYAIGKCLEYFGIE